MVVGWPRSRSGAGCLENVLKKPGRPMEDRTPRGAAATDWVGEDGVSGCSAMSAVSGRSSSSWLSFDGGVVVILKHEVYAEKALRNDSEADS